MPLPRPERRPGRHDGDKDFILYHHFPSDVLGGKRQRVCLAPPQEYCKKLFQALDKIDEDRYDAEAKVVKTDKEVETLTAFSLSQVGRTEPRSVRRLSGYLQPFL